MSDIVPFILAQEQAQLNGETAGRPLSIIFDRISSLREAIVMIANFVDSDWIIQQRLIRFQLMSESLTGEEVARDEARL